MNDQELLADPVLEYGDREAAQRGQILRSTVGSGVHGIAIAGTDDHDEMAVFVEPAEWVLGSERGPEHYVARSQPEGARSGHGDTDLIAYTLRKYLRLAVKGNPTALLPLFAPESDLLYVTELGHELRALGRRSCRRRPLPGSSGSCARSGTP
jgi:predicted nucleotidyltransferase